MRTTEFGTNGYWNIERDLFYIPPKSGHLWYRYVDFCVASNSDVRRDGDWAGGIAITHGYIINANRDDAQEIMLGNNPSPTIPMGAMGNPDWDIDAHFIQAEREYEEMQRRLPILINEINPLRKKMGATLYPEDFYTEALTNRDQSSHMLDPAHAPQWALDGQARLLEFFGKVDFVGVMYGIRGDVESKRGYKLSTIMQMRSLSAPTKDSSQQWIDSYNKWLVSEAERKERVKKRRAEIVEKRAGRIEETSWEWEKRLNDQLASAKLAGNQAEITRLETEIAAGYTPVATNQQQPQNQQQGQQQGTPPAKTPVSVQWTGYVGGNTVSVGQVVPALSTPTLNPTSATASYAATPATVCTVNSSSGALTIVGAGSCQITLTATPGDSSTHTATEASVTVTINPGVQTLSSSNSYGSGASTLVVGEFLVLQNAPTGGVTTLEYQTTSSGVCTVDRNSGDVTADAAGSCVAQARWTASSDYSASAWTTIHTFSINKKTQSALTVTNPYGQSPSVNVGATLAITTTPSGGHGPLEYQSGNTGACTVNASGAVSGVSTNGTCTIQARFAGNNAYASTAWANIATISVQDQQVQGGQGVEGTPQEGTSVYVQVKGLVNRLRKALKTENLFNKADFGQLEKSIKDNKMPQAFAKLDAYEKQGGKKVKRAVKRLRKMLKSILAVESLN